MLKSILKNFLNDQSFILRVYHHLRAWFAAIKFGLPTKDMYVIAVTGTNGKTSMCNLLYQSYKDLGVKVSMLSTVNYAICDQLHDNLAKMSTLPPMALNKMLAKMRDAGTQVLILEATSHAAYQGRLNGIDFDQLIFTNMGKDHLEYHGSFEKYLSAKVSLIYKIKKDGCFIYNSDSDYIDAFLSASKVPNFGFGMLDSDLVKVESVQLSLVGSEFDLILNRKKCHLQIALLGHFNVLNAAAVASSIEKSEFDLNLSTLKQLSPVPGRLDVMVDDKNVYVCDYAHDPQSLETLLQFVSDYKQGSLRLLFGCTGGGRDKSKRPQMGAVASKYADFIYLTNDDPYSEDPQQIIDDIKSGIVNFTNVTEIIPREEAIKIAYNQMQTGDVLVLAGKGGEKITVINGEVIPLDEKQILSDLINAK